MLDVALCACFAAFLLARNSRGISFSTLCSIAFALAAIGYLTTPYRPIGGAPLGVSETARFVLCALAMLIVVRMAAASPDADTRLTTATKVAAIAIGSMLACDVAVVALQLTPGFDYADFTFRTAFSGCGVGALVVLLLEPAPKLDAAIASMRAEGPTSKQPTIDAQQTATPMPTPQQRAETFAAAYGLTARETEVFALMAAGRDVPYIERELVLAKSTVKTHVKHIYAKCDVSSKQDLLDKLEDFQL